jgi:tyrosyl-tRNA synthetase
MIQKDYYKKGWENCLIMSLSVDERFNLITRNSQEVITEDELKKLLSEKEHPVVYIGTSITGRPHIGYFVWVLKLSDFLKAGFKVKLLLADLHGALDNCPWDLLEKRFEYYSHVILKMFDCIGTDVKNFEIVKGSDFQLNKDYVLDLMKMSTFTTIRDANKAASDVVKFGDNPKLSGLIYPLMQALDEQYLGVDVQYGGLDQRKILMFARENLPKLGYKSRVEFMTPLIPGLSAGGKMSSSDPNSKIDLIDDEETIKKKINKAHCPEKEIEGNGVLAFCKYVLMTIKEDNSEEFLIERPEKFGGNISFKTYSELESAYVEGKLHPMDLKTGLANEIVKLTKPIRDDMENNQELIKSAYPETN